MSVPYVSASVPYVSGMCGASDLVSRWEEYNYLNIYYLELCWKQNISLYLVDEVCFFVIFLTRAFRRAATSTARRARARRPLAVTSVNINLFSNIKNNYYNNNGNPLINSFLPPEYCEGIHYFISSPIASLIYFYWHEYKPYAKITNKCIRYL